MMLAALLSDGAVCWPPFACAPQFLQNFASSVVGLPQDAQKMDRGSLSLISLNDTPARTKRPVNRGYHSGYQPGTDLNQGEAPPA
jgi:hypothetical protein